MDGLATLVRVMVVRRELPLIRLDAIGSQRGKSGADTEKEDECDEIFHF
jgi:hypothetical protein